MRIITGDDIHALVDIPALIPVIAAAMREVSARAVEMPVRTTMPLPGGNRLGMMPGYLGHPAVYGAKLLSLFPNNPAQGRSSHAGLMLIFDIETGLASACLDASVLTALRTAAATAVATDCLARKDARRVAIVGAGEQAHTHILAMRAVRPGAEVVVWGRAPDRAASVARTHDAETAATLDQAMAGADIICTVTSSAEPFVTPNMLPAGVHLNAVGGSIPAMRELDPNCLPNVRVVTDYRPALEAGAWEVIEARARGLIAPDHPIAEIGEILAGAAVGRRGPDERTLYRSLGVAAQDLAAAQFILERAIETGRGVEVAFG